MNDWQNGTRADYERKGFAGRSGYGKSPVLLVVDFINGFTDPSTPLGGNFAWEINAGGCRSSTRRSPMRRTCATAAFL